MDTSNKWQVTCHLHSYLSRILAFYVQIYIIQEDAFGQAMLVILMNGYVMIV